MGIPSYYRKLIRSCPHLVQDGADAADSQDSQDSRKIQWFFMDYNCLIYHCLYRPDAPVYPSEAETDSSIKTAWEAAFIKSVVEYTMYVIRQVNPEKGVYIAIDGVVPMAKMRQQRLRRFKSSWLSSRGYGRDGKKEESEEKEAVARWNTNAITPGTVFMDALYEALTRMIKAEGKTGVWRISSCREWGEGEHKIMAEWRKGYGGKGSIAVYGLDADLIVLSLLGIEVCGLKEGVWLFREIVERGTTQYDMFGRERYEWFSVDELRRWLVAPYLGSPMMEQSFIIQYTFMMSFLGNDFLPSSLSYKMRDDGHGMLLDLLRWFFAGNVLLVGGADEGYPIRQEGLTAFFQALALNESERITATIWKKKRMAHGIQGNNLVGVGHEDWPLAVMEEDILLDSRGQLSEDWQHQYITHFFHGFPWHPSSVKTLCRQYLYGVQWVWAYYLGRTEEVCFEWWYPFSLPPLWAWLSESELPTFLGTVQVKGSDIAPTEQLALVLPLESWSLLPPCPQRALPDRAPHLFPTEFSFDSVGKRFFWECESMIPVPTIREVKAWCS